MNPPPRDHEFDSAGDIGGRPDMVGRSGTEVQCERSNGKRDPLAGLVPRRVGRDRWRDADVDTLPGELTPALLEDFEECSGEINQMIVRLVDMAGLIGKSTDCARVAGMDGDDFLGLVGQQIGADRYLLQNTSVMLASMPATDQLFRDGYVPWGVVREVAKHARGLRIERRQQLDAYVEAIVGDPDVEGWLHPDELLQHIVTHVHHLEQLQYEEHADRAGDGEDTTEPPDADSITSWLARQQSLFGTMRIHGELSATDAATVNQALEQAAGRLPAGCKSPAGVVDPARRVGRWSTPTQSQRAAAGLRQLCADALGGIRGVDKDGKVVHKPAKPLFTIHIDIDHIVGGATDRAILGLVRTGLRGPLAHVGAATLAALAKDADVQAVLFDKARPLAVTGKVNAADIPIDIRRAVIARDAGDRWPGSDRPPEHCDIHHIRHRQHGGNHEATNLGLFGRRSHTAIHEDDWDVTLDPDTAVVTVARDGRRFRSLPQGRQARKPNGADPPGDPPAARGDPTGSDPPAVGASLGARHPSGTNTPHTDTAPATQPQNGDPGPGDEPGSSLDDTSQSGWPTDWRTSSHPNDDCPF